MRLILTFYFILAISLPFVPATSQDTDQYGNPLNLPQYGSPNQNPCSNQNNPNQQFFNYQQLTCSSCASWCQTCHSNTQCLTCQPGYALTSTNDCVLCTGSCQTCSYPSLACLTCARGYYMQGLSICMPCATNCDTCTGNTQSTCLTCKAGYYLDAGNTNNNCQSQCSSHCNGCSGPNNADCTQCSTYSFFDSNNVCNICNMCDASCSQCTGPLNTQCTNCRDSNWFWNSDHTRCISCSALASQHFDPVSFTCIQCPINCNKCQSLDVCEVCSQNSYLLLGVCMTTCPSIYTPATVNGVLKCIVASCLAPLQFFDYEYLICKNCQVNCLSCSSINNCFTCSNGFTLKSGVCVPNNWATDNTCPASQWIQPDGVTCLPCADPFCAECVPSGMCVTCIAPNVKTYFDSSMTLNKCVASCQSGYTVVDGVCIKSNFLVSQSDINNFIPFSVVKVNLDSVGITFSKNQADIEYIITGTIPAGQYFPPNNICGNNPNNYLTYDATSSLTTVYVVVSLTQFMHCGFTYTDSTNSTLTGYIVSIYRATQKSYTRQVSFQVQNQVGIEMQSHIGDAGTTINMDLLIAVLPNINTFTTAPVVVSAGAGQTGTVNNPIAAVAQSVMTFQIQLPADLTSSYGLVLPSFASLVNTQMVLTYRVTMNFVQTTKNTFAISVDLSQVANMIDGIYDLSFTAGIYILGNRRRMLADADQAKIDFGLVITVQPQNSTSDQNVDDQNISTTTPTTTASQVSVPVLTSDGSHSSNGPSVVILVGIAFASLIGISVLFLVAVLVLKRRRDQMKNDSEKNPKAETDISLQQACDGQMSGLKLAQV